MTAARMDGQIGAVRRVLVRILAVEVLALLATGVYLALFYRPTAAQAWNDIYGVKEDMTLAASVRTAHRWLSWVAVATSLVLGVVLVAEGADRWRGPELRRRGVLTGPLVVLVVVAASVTGMMLPWDQIALWAVTVGTDMQGYRPFFGDGRARFVLIGGSEVSLGTLRTVLIVHAAVLPLVLTALLAWSNRRGHGEPAPAGAPDLGSDRQDVVIAATGDLSQTG